MLFVSIISFVLLCNSLRQGYYAISKIKFVPLKGFSFLHQAGILKYKRLNETLILKSYHKYSSHPATEDSMMVLHQHSTSLL